mmetsp:Transcript_25563/g.45079  ORF Transcript_25563/g.45079 Transcript_25563/m.45079 type:complete len:239 (+) Transcript_25563:358-1074(+)
MIPAFTSSISSGMEVLSTSSSERPSSCSGVVLFLVNSILPWELLERRNFLVRGGLFLGVLDCMSSLSKTSSSSGSRSLASSSLFFRCRRKSKFTTSPNLDASMHSSRPKSKLLDSSGLIVFTAAGLLSSFDPISPSSQLIATASSLSTISMTSLFSTKLSFSRAPSSCISTFEFVSGPKSSSRPAWVWGSSMPTDERNLVTQSIAEEKSEIKESASRRRHFQPTRSIAFCCANPALHS